MYRGIKKQNNLIKTAAWLFCFVFLFFIMPSGAYAATSSKVTLPVKQEFMTNETGLSVSVEYILTAQEQGNPMPEGSSGGIYTLTLQSDQKSADIVITFTKPGTYHYELTEKTLEDFPFTWKPQTYRITVLVGQDFATILTIRNEEGNKVSVMAWAYAAVAQPTPAPTVKPTVKPTPAGTGQNDGISKVPQTGDQSEMELWVFLGVLSSLGLLGCGYLLFRTRKRKEETDE